MRKYSPDELEDLLKERSDQYLIYPSDQVWNNIQKSLYPNRFWTYVSIGFLLLCISGGLVVHNTKELVEVPAPTGQIAYRFIANDPLENAYKNLDGISVKKNTIRHDHSSNMIQHIKLDQREIDINKEPSEGSLFSSEKIELPASVLAISKEIQNRNAGLNIKPSKKNFLTNAFESVVAQAIKISKKADWQFYVTPTASYRLLQGEASNRNFQYSSFPYSTNANFAANVNDAVNHKVGMGLELGVSMVYPLTKKLSLKTGLQFNYNHYQIEAYRGTPEIATYGMNNLGYGGSYPISTMSYYRNGDGYYSTTLRNEHYMISMPIGMEYIVAGNKKINLAIASSLQPTYVFTNYSYLISTNLKNYAKEPSLNRRFNINSAVEASLNVQSGAYKFSFAPQYRYQLISSFKNRYPIKENLWDMGVKLSVSKTLH